MIPGRTYTPELILKLAWRRKWLIAVPAVVVAVGVAAWTRTLVDYYRSDTLILVVPQRVPESYVRSTVTSTIEERLQAIQQQIMSRTRLERIILDFNLYAEDRQSGIMEDIVEQMRRDVEIAPIRGDAFRVGYISENPAMAMRVTERLASLFIDESLRDREVLAEGTNQFLESQLEEARRLLVDNERRLEDYRRRYGGELPDQLGANQQGLHNTEMQIQAVIDSLNRDRDRRLLLERALTDANAAEVTALPAAAPEAPLTSAQQLTAAQDALVALRLRVTEEHPDVVSLKRRIVELQQRADDEAASRPVSSATASLPPGEAQRRRIIATLTEQIADIDKQMAARAVQEARLRDNLTIYQRRLEATPTRESELTDLMRDYSIYQSQYQSLLGKKQESQMAANLERRQIGEQFRILDPARLPAAPFSPNRPQLYLFGLVGGLLAGLGLAGAVEYFDRTLRSENDVQVALNLPVLAMIPLVSSAAAKRRRFRLMAATVSIGIILASAAVAAWTFLR